MQTISLLSIIKDFIISSKTHQAFGLSPQDWTRRSKLTFERTVMMIFRNHKLPIQNGLIRLFQELKEVKNTPTASAFCHARKKLNPLFFSELNQMIVKQYYELNAENLNLWRGKKLLAIDGTYINVKNTPSIRQNFTLQRNQYQPKMYQGLILLTHF